MSSRLMVKVGNFADMHLDKPKMMMFMVSSCEELISKGASALKFDSSKCEIVTSCETVINDDDVLREIYKTDILFIREIEDAFASKAIEQLESSSLEISKTLLAEKNPTTILSNNPEISSHTPLMENHSNPISVSNSHVGVSQDSPPVFTIESNCLTSNENDEDTIQLSEETQAMLLKEEIYDVPQILIKERQNVKGDSAQTILKRVTETEFCQDHDRLLIGWACGTWLMNNCVKRSPFPTPLEFEKMAKSIIYFFPSTKNRSSSTPWDIWYDANTRKGMLESYVRGKRFRKYDFHKKQQSKKKASALSNSATYTLEEVKAAETYMRTTVLDSKSTPNNNRDEMLQKMKVTRQSRRDFLCNGPKATATVTLNKYPRFKDMQEAVDDEFNFLKNSTAQVFVGNWKLVEKHVVSYAKLQLKSAAAKDLVSKATNAENSYDVKTYTDCAFQLLIHLLANKKPSEKRSGQCTPENSKQYFLQSFKEIILPCTAAKLASKMELPGILEINYQYFLKIDEGAIAIPGNIKMLEEAVAYLLIYYYILNINFPEPLKFVFGFFERLFNLQPSVKMSVDVLKCCSFVCKDLKTMHT